MTKIRNPKDKDIETQIKVFKQIVILNNNIAKLLPIAEQAFKNTPWYIAGGGLNQSVWNYYSDKKIDEGINDYDIIYYSKDITEEENKILQKRINEMMGNVEVDITNVFNVHEWFEKYFGRKIEQFKSLEEDINGFGQTVSTVCLKLENGNLRIYAPYGLNDVFAFQVHPIKSMFSKEDYEKKTSKWNEKWDLEIFPW